MYVQHDFTPLEFSFFSCKILAISQAADLHADTQLSRWQVRNFVIAPRISALQTILYFGGKVALPDRAELTSISGFLRALSHDFSKWHRRCGNGLVDLAKQPDAAPRIYA